SRLNGACFHDRSASCGPFRHTLEPAGARGRRCRACAGLRTPGQAVPQTELPPLPQRREDDFRRPPDHLDAKLDDRQLKLWEHVLKQVRDGAMPPEDAKQPTAKERQAAVAWIERALEIARSRPTPKNGGLRRLTAAQYRNTLRELLLLEDNVADALPPDAVSRDGFVNNQETLQLSPLLLEAYFEIADDALSRCLVDSKAKPSIQNFRVDLGAGINAKPIKDNLILGADSLLLDKRDVVVTQLTPVKPFAFEPFFMKTKYRFIEGYQGNDTVRGWRDYDSIYHSVFACMRGT